MIVQFVEQEAYKQTSIQNVFKIQFSNFILNFSLFNKLQFKSTFTIVIITISKINFFKNIISSLILISGVIFLFIYLFIDINKNIVSQQINDILLLQYQHNRMQLNFLDCHQMKENMDINIINANGYNKNSNSDTQKPTKRQLFGQKYPSNTNENKIKKTAYIVDSDEQQIQQQTYVDKKPILSHRSIDEVSEIIQSLSRQSSFPTSPKITFSTPITTCQSHQNSIFTYNFCLQCCSYMLCPECISSAHSSHVILSFTSQPETKQLTKQFLIQKIEQTLQKLKSKENDIKNKSYEMEIIMKNTKRLQNELMNKLQNTFIDLQQKIRDYYQNQLCLYEDKVNQFFGKYNQAGDELRENLLTIIQESFSIEKFDIGMVCKQPPQVPSQSINKFKLALQKTKKFYKVLGQGLDEIKQKSEKLSLSHKNNAKQSISNKLKRDPKASINKYQKFLTDNCFGKQDNSQSKSSLLKILNTLSQ